MTEQRMADIVRSMSAELASALLSQKVKGNEIWLEVPSHHLPQAASHVHNLWGANLVTFHAVDNRASTGDFKLCLVMALKGEDDFLVLLSSVDPAIAEFPSLTPDIPCAEWYEREIMDMMGLRAVGHPDPRPLVLWDDWPEGAFPLRKDFDPTAPVPRTPRPYAYRRVEGEGVFEIPVGPVHAGVIEPGHFRFSVAGEPILNLELRLGYVHKGVEKLSEGMPYAKGVLLAERISGDNGFAHSLAYCQAVESLAGAQVPDRALFLRSAFAELERIYNLLGDLGGIVLDVAFNVAAQHAHIMRERAMDLNDHLTGSRLLRGVNCLGGVRRDVDAGKAAHALSRLVRLKLDVREFFSLVASTQSVLDRTESTGRIGLQAAQDLNLVGPAARPAGGVGCGPLEVPEGLTAMSLVESPRGELVHWMISGAGGRPFRHKVRDASFHNWRAMEVAVLGDIVPDFPLINKSLNLSYSGNDL